MSADASAKASLCADKTDLSTTPGRMAFAEKMAETRLAGRRQSSLSFRRFMTAWMRSRRKRSTRAGASAASSTGGARSRGPHWTGGICIIVNVRGKSVIGGRGARARKSSNPLLTKPRHPSARPSPCAGSTAASRVSGSWVKMRPIPSRGTVSYVSPLARAVLTHGPGETVEITGREAVILDVR